MTLKRAGAPGVIGRAHAQRRHACRTADHGLGHVDLGRHLLGAELGKVGMVPRVVPDGEPRGHHLCGVVRVTHHLTPDLEERGGHLIALEHREYLRGERTGTVVEGQRHHPLTRRRRPTGRLVRRERRLPAGQGVGADRPEEADRTQDCCAPEPPPWMLAPPSCFPSIEWAPGAPGPQVTWDENGPGPQVRTTVPASLLPRFGSGSRGPTLDPIGTLCPTSGGPVQRILKYDRQPVPLSRCGGARLAT